VLLRSAVALLSHSCQLDICFGSSGGDTWLNATNWLSYAVHECLWYGEIKFNDRINTIFPYPISLPYSVGDTNYTPCTQDQEHYDHLTIPGNGLKGTIPEEILLLSSLQVLDLNYNELSGTIPTYFGKLSKLQHLSIVSNSLRGVLPTEVYLLTDLVYLALTYNQNLTGTLSPDLEKLSALELLTLDVNKFSGTIPTEIGLLAKLQSLDLTDNKLTSTIPAKLALLTELRFLALPQNNFVGSLPELRMSSDLFGLLLHDNELSGTIPTEFGLLTKLEGKFCHDPSMNWRLSNAAPCNLKMLFVVLPCRFVP